MKIKPGSVDCENKKWPDATAFATCENRFGSDIASRSPRIIQIGARFLY
jgi:hypothetical protein